MSVATRSNLLFTAVILTKNEEVNVADCIRSLSPYCNDIHVLDSGSTDRTADLADELGAQVHVNSFESFGQQRNWAIDNIPHRYDWVLHLDADERFTPQLAEEIEDRLRNGTGLVGFHIPSKLMLGSRWLKHSGEYPAFQLRLFNRHQLRFVDSGHGQREWTNGEVGYLTEPYLHLPFKKGIADWFSKHAYYAAREASEATNSCGLRHELSELLMGPAIKRRRAIKALSYRFPGRGALRLFHLLVIRRGLLDGRAGVVYARMKSSFETMTEIQIQANRILGETDSSRRRRG